MQLIGISTLSDAVATVRVDRAPKLNEAIAIFASLQQAAKDNPGYLNGKDAQEKLAKVLELAPQHLSARILLAAAQGKLPKTLSATASEYYTFVAVRVMLGILNERADSTASGQVPSAALRAGLMDLRKLRPLADADVRPLIDAWARFIQAWTALQQGTGSSETLETQRQFLLDEMAQEQADSQMMQKMLKEGV